jgi:hypothetical protein
MPTFASALCGMTASMVYAKSPAGLRSRHVAAIALAQAGDGGRMMPICSGRGMIVGIPVGGPGRVLLYHQSLPTFLRITPRDRSTSSVNQGDGNVSSVTFGKNCYAAPELRAARQNVRSSTSSSHPAPDPKRHPFLSFGRQSAVRRGNAFAGDLFHARHREFCHRRWWL